MKNYCLLCILLLFSVATSLVAQPICNQIPNGTYSVCDDFEDNNLAANPAWTGNIAEFTTESGQLRSNGPAVTGTVLQLTTSFTTLATAEQWEFFANPKLATSSGNYADIYLAASTSDLIGGTDGYFVRLGGTTDNISLFRSDNGSEVLLVAGIASTLSSSTNNPVRVKVTRTSAGVWTLARDLAATGVYTTEGIATDNMYTTSAYAGIKIQYSQANATKFYFDNFYIGDLIVDTTAPIVESVVPTGSTAVLVQFSEIVQQADAENENNYVLNGAITPLSATVVPSDPKQYILTFAQPFVLNNTLQISTIRDLAGNPLNTVQLPFSYYSAQANDLIINEIFADPDPSVGLPTIEFVEVYNRTNLAISLYNWHFTDAYPDEMGAILPNVTISAGGYLLLVPVGGAAAYSGFGTVVEVSGFPSLNNSGDALALLRDDGAVIDAVTYSDSWYRSSTKKAGGWTLERINPDNFCAAAANNWIASENANGGTPGAANSVLGAYPDTTAPVATQVIVSAPSVLTLYLSEPIVDIENASFQLSDNLGIVETTYHESDNTITLMLNNSLAANTIYTLTLDDLQDCNGNISSVQNISVGLPQAALPYDIVINEIYIDLEPPSEYEQPNLDLPAAQFVELYNRSNKVISLLNWEIRDMTDTSYLANYYLLPQSYVVLCREDKVGLFADEGIPALGVASFPLWNTTGDAASLYDDDGILIHAFLYTKASYKDPIKQEGGWTLEMIDSDNPCNTTDNWRASVAPIGGTPAALNSVAADNPDTKSPRLLRAEAVNATTVQLFFDEFLQRELPNNPANYAINNGIGAPASAQLLNTNLTSVLLTLSTPMLENTVYELTVSNLTDCSGNLIGLDNTAKFGLTQAAEAGDIVINEVLFNGKNSGDYVELYNRSAKIIDLSNWYIAGANATLNPDSLISPQRISLQRYSIYPQEYIVLTEDISGVIAAYGGNCANLNDRAFIYADLPSMNDDSGTVGIVDLFNTIELDKLVYNSDWHTPFLDIQDGVSLERIDFNKPTQDASNWQSAASVVCYGTPSYKNSQYFALQAGESDFEISPQTFSPNDDSQNDFTFISYHLAEPGYTANITIFDERGREMLALVKNDLLGSEGVYKWEGNIANGTKAPVGVYVVYIELFNLQGDVKRFKKTCVVSGKFD